MRIQKHPSAKIRVIMAVILGAALSLSATVTHAGFQWVPPSGQKAASGTNNAVPPATSAPTDPVEQMVLPMPGDQIQAQPSLNPGDAAALNTTPQIQSTPDYRAPLAPIPAQEPILKVKTLSPPPAPEKEPVALLASPPPVAVSEPVMAIPLPGPEVDTAPMAAPAAPVVTTKVIMPQDAPQSAMDSKPNSQRLVINPYPVVAPTKEAPAAPQIAAPALEAAPQGDFEVIEGFGADMPLALALQQIVPQGYAYSFGQGVNPGALVTWDGGKPWNQVISDMLAPHSLGFAIEGSRVHVRQAGSYRQGDVAPRAEDLIRRASINDPGEKSQAQTIDLLAGIESAAGESADGLTTAYADMIGPPNPFEKEETTHKIWSARAGESLKDTLARWSKDAGVEMIWMASYDHTLKQDVAVEDSFNSAVQTIVANNADAKSGPDVQFVQAQAAGTGSLLVKDRS